ncbi:programmed cell death 6 protein-like protein [Naegleria gruberi]|uniref:Programmed cell death 6 protein-like protein n=1 Tax=Naegleria gruberi TaxID=5762 RepID=D2VA25_NAEGR|nr:programmed cell death 6 protein-like protein [Naegleria gruberi]EFC46233.1 programmed cell death 6 protein-like protein [Naegleria gruberi]|eukprot:XP_002678977.1 programmed cell death 6 protein-like protein [Naegleria gruberi strain NEG-M]
MNINYAANEALRPLFNAVDLDKSGKITHNELQKVLTMPGSELQGGSFSERCAKRLVKMFDRNGNGSVDFEEYSALHQYLIQMKAGFESVDTNKSGKVEFNEVTITLSRVGFNFSPQIVQKLFKLFDFQNKGSLDFDGYIELCAFLGLMRAQFIPRDANYSGQAMFTWEQFIQACMEAYM